MLVLAGRTLRSRKSAFLGAFVALVLGSAMLMGAVSVIASAASIQATGADRDALDGITSVIGFLAALAAFLSTFIVAGTFAFAVATRSRELALLRMVGATPRQVRRLVRSESLLVGVLGSGIGCVLGLLLGGGIARSLVWLGSAPNGFTLQLSGPTMYVALPVSFATGLIVTWFGAGSAARRASRISPSAALQEADVDARVMTGTRWLAGTLFLGLGIAAVAMLPFLEGDVLIPVGMFLAEPFVVAAVLLSPLFIGRLGAAFVPGGSAVGMVAKANLRTGVRRAASTSAPVVLAVGVCGSLLGMSLVMSAATETSLRERYTGDFVVGGGADNAEALLRQTPGVEGVTTIGRTQVRAVSGDGVWDQPVSATVVEPDTMRSALRLDEVTGSPDRLRGATVLVGRNLAWSIGWEPGGEYSIRSPDGVAHRVTVVGTFQDDPLVQSMLFPADLLAAETSAVHVVAPDVSEQTLNAVVERLPGSTVMRTEAWLEPLAEEEGGGLRSGVWLLSGFALAYTLLAIANTTVLAFRSRRHEFSSLRLLGTGTDQLRSLVRGESVSLGLAGAVVGGAIAFGTTVAVWAALRTSVPNTPFVLPVSEVLVLTACCVGMVTAVSAVVVRRM